MNTWVTLPGNLRQAGFALPFAKAGALSSAAAKTKSCVHSLVGTSVMPASRPRSGRVRTSTAPSARSTQKAAPRRRRPSALGALRGKVSGVPTRRAVQPSFHGQSAQDGRSGVQSIAPRSIMACTKSPGRSAGVRLSARRRMSTFAARRGASTAKRRATTRSMLPSTGVARLPNAIAAIAAAV